MVVLNLALELTIDSKNDDKNNHPPAARLKPTLW